MSSLFHNYLCALKDLSSKYQTVEIIQYHKPQNLVDDIESLSLSSEHFGSFVEHLCNSKSDFLDEAPKLYLVFFLLDHLGARKDTKLVYLEYLIDRHPYFPEIYRYLLKIHRSIEKNTLVKFIRKSQHNLFEILKSMPTELRDSVLYLHVHDMANVPTIWVEDSLNQLGALCDARLNDIDVAALSVDKFSNFEFLQLGKGWRSQKERFLDLSLLSDEGNQASVCALTVVFGREYTETFCRFLEFNINNEIFKQNNVRFIVACTLTDSIAIKNSRAFKVANSRVNIDILIFSEKMFGKFDKYVTCNRIYGELLEFCGAQGCSAIILPPDLLLAASDLGETVFKDKILCGVGIRCNRYKVFEEINGYKEICREVLEEFRQRFLHTSQRLDLLQSPISDKGPTNKLLVDRLLPTLHLAALERDGRIFLSYSAAQVHPFYIPHHLIKGKTFHHAFSLDSDLIIDLLELQGADHKRIQSSINDYLVLVDNEKGPLFIEVTQDKEGEGAVASSVSNAHRSLSWFKENLHHFNFSLYEKTGKIHYQCVVDNKSQYFEASNLEDFRESLQVYYSDPHKENKPSLEIEKLDNTESVLICIPLWGDQYIRKFTNFVAPRLFSNSNMEFLREQKRFLFWFFTEKKDAAIIEGSLRELGLQDFEFRITQCFDGDWLPAEDKYSGKKYTRVTYAHATAAKYAAEYFDYMVPFYADMIVSEDFFTSLFEYFETNSGSILVGMAPPVTSEDCTELLSESFSRSELTDLVITHLHPMIKSCVVAEDIEFNPLGPFIGTKQFDGFLYSSVHLHIIAYRNVIIGNADNFDFNGTIDGSWIYRFDINPLNIIPVETFSTLPIASLMDRDFPEQGNKGRKPIEFMVSFCAQEPDIFDNRFMDYRFLFSREKTIEDVPLSALKNHSYFWQSVLTRLFVGLSRTAADLSIPEHALNATQKSLYAINVGAPANNLVVSTEFHEQRSAEKFSLISLLLKHNIHKSVPKPLRRKILNLFSFETRSRLSKHFERQ